MRVRLANAPVSWGVDYPDTPANPPWPQVMDEIAAAGYRYTELGPYGYYPTDAAALKAAFEARGLSVAAGFLFQPLHDPAARADILQIARKSCALLSGLGAKHYTLIDNISRERNATAGRSEAAPRLDSDQWQAMVALIAEVCRIAADQGLGPVVHQHVGTYIEFRDEVERLLDDLPADMAGLCIDTGHMSYAGMDPVATYETHAGRVPYLHLKDIDRNVHARVIAEGTSFEGAVGMSVFCPLGRGVVDFPRLREALETHGFDGYATVEQDRDPVSPKSPIRDAEESLKFLRGIGMEREAGTP
jgi:inosose dehydratase